MTKTNQNETPEEALLRIAEDMKTRSVESIERLDELLPWCHTGHWTEFVLQIGGPKGNNFLGRRAGQTYASGVHLTRESLLDPLSGCRGVALQAIRGTREDMEENAARYREHGEEQLGRDMSDLSLEVIDLQTAIKRARAYAVYTLTDVIPSIEEKMRSPEDQARMDKFSGGLPQKTSAK